MEAGSTFFIIILSLGLMFILIQFYLKKMKVKQSEAMDYLWRNFNEAIKRNDIQEVERIGLELIYNMHLTSQQLKIMSKNIGSRIEKHPELEKLSLAIMNKELHFGRKMPY